METEHLQVFKSSFSEMQPHDSGTRKLVRMVTRIYEHGPTRAIEEAEMLQGLDITRMKEELR